jgi:GH18 family chitinase
LLFVRAMNRHRWRCIAIVLPLACAAQAPATQQSPPDYKVVGYFTNWVENRQGCEFRPDDVDTRLLTHINFAFAQVDPGPGGKRKPSWHLSPFGGANDLGPRGLYARVNALKMKNPKLKTLLSVGGWSHNDSTMAWRFTTMAESPRTRGEFIANALGYVRANGFDGIDIDWEYPVDSTRGGRPMDRRNFTLLLKELRAAIDAESRRSGGGRAPLLLTIATAQQEPTRFYELADVARNVDWINLMTYDYAGDWSPTTGMNAPNPGIRAAVAAYLDAGVPARKIVLGMPTYGHTFASVESPQPNAPHKGKGPKQPCTGAPGFISYFEANELVRSGRLRRYWDDATATPYAYDAKNKVWVTYDDTASIRNKTDIIEDLKLGGAMFWAIDLDDYRHGYPLITTVARRLLKN